MSIERRCKWYDDVITYIPSCKLTSKTKLESFEWSKKELDKDKLEASEKTQLMGDGSSELISDLSMEEIDISDTYIS